MNDDEAEAQPRRRERRRRRKGEKRFGDPDFTLSSIDEYDEALWSDVCHACCSHTPEEIFKIFLGIVGLAFFQYFYFFGLDLFVTSANVLSGCRAGSMFLHDMNPVSSVMLTTIGTALIKSSSTMSSVIVLLISENTITVSEAVYLVMGANIGTTITSDVVALAQMYNLDEYERAFTAGTIHDAFNILTVCILLPFEVLTGYLESLTKLIVDGAETKDGSDWQGPVLKYVRPLVNKLIVSNRKAIIQVAQGESCDNEAWYPTRCIDGLPESFATCKTGFVACDKSTGKCPAWFRQGATLFDDQVAGGVSVVLAITIIYISITGLMMIAQWLLKGLSTRVVYKVVNMNGYLGIALGAGLTMLLQSSSLTTSILVPWGAIGVIRLEQMFPLVLGANIGTTLTAILTALVASGLDPLQVALMHLFFNITGVLIWYPIPHMRKIPMYVARKLGRGVRVWRMFGPLYICFTFFIIPSIILATAGLFSDGNVAAGAVTVTLLVLFVIGMAYWWTCRGGADTVERFFAKYKWRREENGAPTSFTDDDDDLNAEPEESKLALTAT